MKKNNKMIYYLYCVGINTYDAQGSKLRAEYWTIGTFNPGGPIGPASLGGGAEPQGGGIVGPILPPINQNDPQVVTDYCGNLIYRNETLSMLLTEEGYVTFDERGEPLYHYYLKDHLGSIRVVFDQSGAVEQKNDYYPSGTLMYTSTNGTLQPYKFGGKELERTAGLDEYDFGARWMDPVIGGRFTTMDPMCEKYYGISPYVYCGGDPVNRIDPDGEDDYWAFSDGKVLRFNRTDTDYDRLYGAVDNTIQSIQINDHEILQQLSSERTDFAGHYAVSSNADEVSKIFLFLANSTDVEWALVGYNTDKGKQYILNNSRNDYQNAEESVNRVSHIFPTEKMFINIHSHPRKDGCDFASGQSYYRYTEGNHYDLPVSDATTMNEVYLAVQKYYGNQYPMEFYPLFFIYNARTGKKIQYNNHYRNINRGVVKRYQDLLRP